MKLTLFHFFPDQLNLHGARGNIIALKMRAAWQGIDLDVEEIKDCSSVNLRDADLLFIGGGSRSMQVLCMDQMLPIKEELKATIEDGVSALTICSGYELLGDHFKLANGEKLKALSILDSYTELPSDKSKTKLIGNVIVESEKFASIVGFENHDGRTYHDYETLGKVMRGHGNNGQDGREGLLYKNLIGTYLHGPVLPKNPNMTDFLLNAAYERKTGHSLPALKNNKIEMAANDQVKDLFTVDR